jgi:hypothetical protein
MEMLLSRDVLRMLYRLGERSGMTWFRKEVREMGSGLAADDPHTLAKLEAAETTWYACPHELA